MNTTCVYKVYFGQRFLLLLSLYISLSLSLSHSLRIFFILLFPTLTIPIVKGYKFFPYIITRLAHTVPDTAAPLTMLLVQYVATDPGPLL